MRARSNILPARRGRRSSSTSRCAATLPTRAASNIVCRSIPGPASARARLACMPVAVVQDRPAPAQGAAPGLARALVQAPEAAGDQAAAAAEALAEARAAAVVAASEAVVSSAA